MTTKPNRIIPMFKPALDEQEAQAAAEVVRSGWLGLGPKTDQFETEFAQATGSRFAVGFSGYTAALDVALRLLEIGPGDEVIVPTLGFLATAHCVAHTGATLIFADVLPDTLTVDPDDVAARISSRTRAVIAIHHNGYPCDIDRLEACTARLGIKVIEDASQACGAQYKGQPVGALGDLACFNFYPTTTLAMPDGGAITTSDESLAERARRLRWLGVGKETWDQAGSGPPYWRQYLVEEISLKCHMTDLAAAVGLVQLNKLEANLKRREAIAQLYHSGLKNIPELERPPIGRGRARPAWHTYSILCSRRDALNAWLREHGIASEVQYVPLHTYACYGNRPTLPVAERLAERTLSLPLYPALADIDLFRTVNAVKAFFLRRRSLFPGHDLRAAARSATPSGTARQASRR